MKANLVEIQPENHRNGQKAQDTKMGPFVINLENLFKTSPKMQAILQNLDFRFF